MTIAFATTAGCSRRRFLSTAAMSLVGAAALDLAMAAPASAQTKLSPDDALKALIEGNRRFTSQQMQALDEDLSVLRAHTEEQQEPFAAILSCADSRVPVELIFDQSIGHLFVARVAGNVASPEMIASLEYGAAVLGTPLIMVLGHSHCGAVKAAMAGGDVPGQIGALYAPLRPAVDQAAPDLEATVKANTLVQAKLLREASPVLAALARSGKLKVVAGYYDLANGRVDVLG